MTTIAKGTPVVISGGPYGTAPRADLMAQGIPPMREDEVAQDGAPAVYDSPYRVPGWHLIHVATRTDGTELLAPLSEGMFTVADQQ